MKTASEIFEQKQQQLSDEKIAAPPEQMKRRAEEFERTPLDFRGAIMEHRPGIIAPIGDQQTESPSMAGCRAGQTARTYQEQGADCLAVEARWRFFNEKETFMRPIREDTSLPILCCDYTIEAYQIYQSFLLGADAILLMAQLLTNEAQYLLVSEAHRLGLQTVTLVDAQELVAPALQSGTDMIAANNAVGPHQFSLARTKVILSVVPSQIPGLSFGGVRTHAQLRQVAAEGAAGALVETACMVCERADAGLPSAAEDTGKAGHSK